MNIAHHCKFYKGEHTSSLCPSQVTTNNTSGNDDKYKELWKGEDDENRPHIEDD